ncbi:hypothetical protein RSOLAG22IIIB_09391 [Rhizoctonia solani]|uniref:Phosphatidic acid phosphatase type 2/haloperoxidase domain-containing protein n=1 Tax=Rhizoctonia solani TaxID=456999 RepID=A0A0K6FY22_9AGAM|nr:unnamed protein product [Rhizoctonia solani]CUA71166.1 hypothetical protein RSOLAG22IIIB_09391 [Rhizoctonia solani]
MSFFTALDHLDCEAFLNDFPHLKLLFKETQSLFISATIVLVLLTRAAGIAYFGLGVIVVCMLAKKLKRMIRQPRPVGTDKVTYGMPSTHSAAITFYAVYIILAANLLPIHPAWHFPTSPYVRVIPSVISIPWATGVSLSRVGLHHHTMSQVGAGCLLGAITAAVWFKLWIMGLNQWGAVVETGLHHLLGF